MMGVRVGHVFEYQHYYVFDERTERSGAALAYRRTEAPKCHKAQNAANTAPVYAIEQPS